MKIKTILTGLIGLVAVLAIANKVYADDSNQNQATYINGGIGQEESDEIRQQAGDYNLRLYFSEGIKGHSIVEVPVKITDKRGNVKLELADAGPMLFVHLANGTYKITSEYYGVVYNRTVKIVNRKGVNVYLNWKSSEAESLDEAYEEETVM